jgi:hypothetical protein
MRSRGRPKHLFDLSWWSDGVTYQFTLPLQEAAETVELSPLYLRKLVRRHGRVSCRVGGLSILVSRSPR